MHEVALFAFIVLGVAMMMVGSIQAHHLRLESHAWPEVDGIVAKTYEGGITVTYEFASATHTSRPGNIYSVETDRKHVGGRVRLRVDPSSSKRCVLLPDDPKLADSPYWDYPWWPF
jgi:hypothetical protein